MAYPPTTPVNNRANSTPLPTNHPNDHNAISNALTDIINVLGATPQGAAASATARFEAAETRITAAEGDIDTAQTDIDALQALTAALPRIGFGTYSGTTNGTTSALVVTHGLAFTPTQVIVQPATPNGVTGSDRYVTSNVTAITDTTFTIGRCVAQDGTLLTGVAVTGYFIAIAAAA
jgi:hypothetical protein